MSPLRDLLDELADEQPEPHVPADTWRRARRARRREVAWRTGGVAAALLALTLGSTLALVSPTGPPTLPAAPSGAPALPDALHAVPERLAPRSGNGYTWDRSLAAPSLAVGTTAAVFPVNEGAVVAVSAQDGRYRGLDLPGFDPDAYVRFDDPVASLSPDGRRLAYTWNPYVVDGRTLTGYEPSGVRILDLEDGHVEDFRIEQGYGVYAHGFGWSPDGHWLTYHLDTATSGDGQVQGGRHFLTERLDTRTGERELARGLNVSDSAPAVSDAGVVASVGNGAPQTWDPRRRPPTRKFAGGVGESTAAWSAAGDRLVAGSVDRGWFSVGDPDGLGLRSRTAASAPPGSRVTAVAWTGPDEVALLVGADPGTALVAVRVPPATGGAAAGGAEGDAEGDAAGGERTLITLDAGVSATRLSLATELLDAPTRAAPVPDWPLDWARVGALGALGGAGALVLAAGLLARSRRPARRRWP